MTTIDTAPADIDTAPADIGTAPADIGTAPADIDSPPADAAGPDDAVAELTDRLFTAGVGALELCAIYLGERLGLYRCLAADGPATADELAGRAGIDRRYAREWLQAQAVAGFVTGTDPHGHPDIGAGRFALAPGVAEVLVDRTHPAHLGGLAQCLAALGGVLPRLADAYRSGAPVTYSDYGPDAVAAQAALNRPAFANSLVQDWLPAVPDLDARLRDTDRPAVVGDFGCGAGWASIALATALPQLRIVGVDNDEASVTTARRNAVEHGVADRVRIDVADVCDPAGIGADRFDVIFFFECVHDLPRPVQALRAARQALRPDGLVVVMDERAQETFTAPGDPVERFFASASALWCLPQGLVGENPEPIGTLIRPDTMRAIASEAGFGRVEVLPIDHPFWRFYRMEP